MCYTILQNRKTTFYAIKTTSSKSRKIEIFPNGLTHGFGPKMTIFPTFFLGNIGQENAFYDILERKNDFLRHKTRTSKSPKIEIFPRALTHAFGQKNFHFSKFFFQVIQARKMSLTIFQNVKPSFQALKSKTSKRRKIEIIPKRLTHGFGSKISFFSNLFFQALQARKMCCTIFQNEKTPFLAIKPRSSKSRKLEIFQKGVNPLF